VVASTSVVMFLTNDLQAPNARTEFNITTKIQVKDQIKMFIVNAPAEANGQLYVQISITWLIEGDEQWDKYPLILRIYTCYTRKQIPAIPTVSYLRYYRATS
jgi:hypothetical protein